VRRLAFLRAAVFADSAVANSTAMASMTVASFFPKTFCFPHAYFHVLYVYGLFRTGTLNFQLSIKKGAASKRESSCNLTLF
jgi:hypothetical protein